MDLNDSSELAYTLCGSSIRDAVSPGSRRVSSGSLLDVMDEVGPGVLFDPRRSCCYFVVVVVVVR